MALKSLDVLVLLVLILNYVNCCNVIDYNPSTDYFPIKSYPIYSQFYSIQYHNSFKVIQLPNVRNSSNNYHYVLYQCGTPKPTAIEAGLSPSQAENALFLSIPIGNIAITSTTYVAYLEAIGMRSAIAGVIDSFDIYSPCVQKMVQDGDAVDFKDYGDYSYSNTYNTTLLQEHGVQLAFGDSYDLLVFQQSSGSKIEAVLVEETMEVTGLARAEWMKFFAYFFNQESLANDQFTQTVNLYNCHTFSALQTITNAVKKNPTVFWGYYFYGAWYVDNVTSYYSKEISDAGGRIITIPGVTTNTPLNFSQVTPYLMQANVFMYSGFNWDEVYAANASFFNTIPSVINKQVFSPDLRPDDWFETAVVQPDIILQDFINILNPSVQPYSYSRVYWRNVFTQSPETMPTASDCSNISSPLYYPRNGCPQSPISNYQNGQCIPSGTFDSIVDYFPQKLQSSSSSNDGYSVEYYKSYKVVKNLRSGNNYVLVQCGAPTPNSTELALNGIDVNNSVNSTEIITIPLTNVAVATSAYIAMIELLQQRQFIRATTSTQFISSSCMLNNIASGYAVDASFPTNNQVMNSTLLQLLEIQATFDNSNDGNYPNVIVLSEDDRTTAVGRAGWSEYLSTFFNAETIASSAIELVSDRYSCITNNLTKTKKSPKVFWGYVGSDGNWYVGIENEYYYNLITNAGGEMILIQNNNNNNNNNGNNPLTFVNAIQYLQKADILLYSGFNWESVFKKNVEYFNNNGFSFIVHEKVFAPDLIDNAWLETAVVEPDVVLADIVNILFPSKLNHSIVYWRQVWKQSAGSPPTSSQCSNNNTQLSIVGTLPSDCEYLKNKNYHPNSNSSKRAGTIAGAVIGSVFGAALLFFVFALITNKKRSNDRGNNGNQKDSPRDDRDGRDNASFELQSQVNQQDRE